MRPEGLGRIKRILIVLTEGGMGDLLFGAPMAEAFCRNYPDAHVTFWTNPRHRPILYNNPYVHDFIDVPEGITLRERAEIVRKGGFDLAVLPWTCSRQTWAVYFAGIPYRVGRDDKPLYSWSFTHRLKIRSTAGDKFSHWIDVELDFARRLGCDVFGIRPRIWLTDEERSAAVEFLGRHGVGADDRLCVMQISRGIEIMNLDKWPIEKFVAIGNMLIREFGLKLLLTGGANESDVVSAVESRVPGSVSIAGETDLRMLCGIVSHADVVVSPDSGPAHIAAALDVPAVSIFAPRKSFPYRWRPYGDIHRVILADRSLCKVKYKGCFPDRCPCFVCLLGIDEFDVIRAVGDILKAGAEERKPAG